MVSRPDVNVEKKFGISNGGPKSAEVLPIDCLSFVVCPLVAPYHPRHFPFFAAAINNTNEANKAGSTCH
jgi:hypothetical protein